MHNREQAFRTRSADAARLLGTVPERLVSLKVCDDVGDRQAYQEFLNALTGLPGVKSTPADGKLQGTGHVVENLKTRIVVVEHETGPEIFYIAGSIASLLGLIPPVLKCWAAIRGFTGLPCLCAHGRVELRRLDEKGRLVEDRSHDLTFPWEHPLGAFAKALSLAAEKLDAKAHDLREGVHALTGRDRKRDGRG